MPIGKKFYLLALKAFENFRVFWAISDKIVGHLIKHLPGHSLIRRISIHLLLNFKPKSHYSSVSFNTSTSTTLKNEAVTNEE